MIKDLGPLTELAVLANRLLSYSHLCKFSQSIRLVAVPPAVVLEFPRPYDEDANLDKAVDWLRAEIADLDEAISALERIYCAQTRQDCAHLNVSQLIS